VGLCCRIDGAALWAAVFAAWQHYSEWLAAVVPLMALLSECVSAERAAEVRALIHHELYVPCLEAQAMLQRHRDTFYSGRCTGLRVQAHGGR
jgi:hypothetical protein